MRTVSIVVLLAMGTSVIASSSATTQTSDTEMNYNAGVEQIDRAALSGDIKAIRAMLDGWIRDLDSPHQDATAELILSASRQLLRLPGGKQEDSVSYRALVKMLSSPSAGSLHVRTEAAAILFQSAKKGGATRPEDRDACATLLLRVWKQLYEVNASSVRQGPSPLLHAPLPLGVWGEPGMSPAAIQDPVKRREYEKAIQQHAQEVEQYNEYEIVRRLLVKYDTAFERQIVANYGQRPVDLEALQKLLKAEKIDPKLEARLTRAVQAQKR